MMATNGLANTVCLSSIYRRVRERQLENLTGPSCFDTTNQNEYKRNSSCPLEKSENEV
jgi:hypothetical protein